jgi:hypothetical protein
MTGLILAAALAAAPLKIITNVKSSRICDTLIHNVFEAIQGLQVNDELVATGGMMMVKMRSDAVADPGGVLGGHGVTVETGGAGASSRMDDVQLGSLAHSLALNLARLETLLGDAQRFPADPKGDGEQNLQVVKSRLEAVVAKQRVALDILSETYDSNELADLLAVGSPFKLIATDSKGRGGVRLTMPEYLQLARQQTALTENDVGPAVVPVAAACR